MNARRITPPTSPLSDHCFIPPIRRGPDDFVRTDSDTGHISGYLRPADGPLLGGHRGPKVTVDPRAVVIDPALTTTIATTRGDIQGLPLYAVATGSVADPSLSHDSASQFYAELGQVIGHVTAGQNDSGLWVAGVITDPTLTEELWTDVTETAVRADWRLVDDRYELVALYVRVEAANLPQVIRRHALTKGDLLRLLTTGDLADAPDDALMIVVKDGEGNACSPLASISATRYMPLSTWSGELVRDEDADDTDLHAITLDPVN